MTNTSKVVAMADTAATGVLERYLESCQTSLNETFFAKMVNS